MKKRIFIFISIGCLICLFIVFLLKDAYKIDTRAETSQPAFTGKTLDEVGTASDDFSVQINDIEALLNGEIVGIVYFGRDTCDFCLTLNAILKEYVNEDLIIYKFDTDIWRNDDRFQSVLDKYGIKSVPALVSINKDKTFAQFIPDETLSDKEVEESLQQFLNGTEKHN